MEFTPEGLRLRCLELAVRDYPGADIPGFITNIARSYEAYILGTTSQALEAQVAEKIAAA